MTRCPWSVVRRAARGLVVLCAVCGALAVIGAAPSAATASDCPSYANVTSFYGTASVSFSGSASDGTISVSLSRSANLTYQSLTPIRLSNGTLLSFMGVPSGGAVSVTDSYSDSATGYSGDQSGMAPPLPYPASGKAAISVPQAGLPCTYDIEFSFAIGVTSAGDWPYSPTDLEPDSGVAGDVGTPFRAVPSDLHLIGTAVVPWEGSLAPDQYQGTFSEGFVPGNGDVYPSAYDQTTKNAGLSGGNATVTWNFTPVFAPSSCPVGGVTTASRQRTNAPAAATAQGTLCHLWTPAQKQQFRDEEVSWARKYALYCGAGPADPFRFLRSLGALLGPLQIYCDSVKLYIEHLQSLADNDPPASSVGVVALPAVPVALKPKSRGCRLSPAECRRAGAVASAYVNSFEQLMAVASAAVISEDRFGSAPSEPEDLLASPPVDSRRLQAAAAAMYTGLLAAWSEPVNSARLGLIALLDTLGPTGRVAASRIPQMLAPKLLWQTFHQMSGAEYTQLAEDLLSQTVQEPAATYLRAHPSAPLSGGQRRMLQTPVTTGGTDAGAITTATTPPNIRRAIGSFDSYLNSLASIPGFHEAAPNGALAIKLLEFTAQAFTKTDPAPPITP